MTSDFDAAQCEPSSDPEPHTDPEPYADPEPTTNPERCDLKWFIEIVELVNNHTDEDQLIAAVLAKLQDFEVAAEVVVRRLSSNRDWLAPFPVDHGDGLRSILRKLPVPVAGSYEGHALETDRLTIVHDDQFPEIQLDRDYLGLVKHVREAGVVTSYFYPMTAHKRIGTVTFYGFKNIPFDEERHELARRTVRVLASGIEKCRLLASADRRRSELDAASAQLESSNRDLQDFAYVASHDLQEPLRKIQTFGDRLESRAADRLSASQRRHLERMTSASQKMQTLINDLLRFSGATTDSGRKQVQPLSKLLATAIDNQRREHGLDGLQIEVGVLPSAEVNETQFVSVFETLIENAWTYRSDTREPTLTVTAAEGRDIGDRYTGQDTAGEQVVVLHVTDNGIGFDPRYAERVFQPFYRLHSHSEYEGSGIGLAICDRVIDNHGGSITADSQIDGGATFTLTFPTIHEHLHPQLHPDPDRPGDSQ